MKEETVRVKDISKMSCEEIKEHKSKVDKAYDFYGDIFGDKNIMLELLELEKNNIEQQSN